MKIHPRLETPRLNLRPFVAEDAPRLAAFAGSREIADTMITIPHPFSESIARATIAANAAAFQSGRSVHFAVDEKASGVLIGSGELLGLDSDNGDVELVGWIAPDAWRQGYATEGAAALVGLAFEQFGANRVFARHMVRDPVAGAVLRKAGMRLEGVLRESARKWDRFEDIAAHAILRREVGSAGDRHPGEVDASGWRGSRASSRERTTRNFDAAGAEDYEAVVGTLSSEDADAYRADLAKLDVFVPGTRVLDAGAGTGTLCHVLAGFPGLALTALEPAPAMAAMLREKPGLGDVRVVEGFCDSAQDAGLFAPDAFDVVASRQVVNGLFDPLAAFANWYRWLAPGGVVVVIEGLYPRSAWRGDWAQEVDVLPLSAVETTALVPYLLESSGFAVERVERMEASNARPATRTPRYVVVARRS